jgi:hypothetical protein
MRLSLRRGGIIAIAALVAACATSIVDPGALPIDDQDAGRDREAPPDDVDPAPDASTKKDSGTPDTGTTGDTGTDTGSTPDSGTPDTGADTGTCTKVAPSNVCGLAPQCGCNSGQTCDVTGTAGETACINAGTAQMGRACTATGGCALGLGCWGGACRPYCATAGQACGTAGTNQCLQLMNGATPVPNLKVCLINCALDDPNSCGGLTPAGQPVAGCDASQVNGVMYTDCLVAGRSTTTCNPSANQYCAPGYACLTSNLCKRWCKVGNSACTCNSLNPKVVISGQEYGVCSN